MIGPSIFAGTLAELTYPELEAAAARGVPVLLPVGVIEQHGPHLPLGTDVYGAHRLCTLVAEQLAQAGQEALIAPPFYWGVNAVTSAFAGSFRTRPAVAAMLLEDVIGSMLTDGFDDILLINHHGDYAHNRVLLGAVQDQHAKGNTGVRFVETPDLIQRVGGDPADGAWLCYEMPAEAAKIRLSGVLGVHAHEPETALIEHWSPDLVRAEELAGLEPTNLDLDDLAEWRKGGEHARRVTPRGYFGAPRPVDPETWRLYELRAAAIAAVVLADARARGAARRPRHDE